MTYIHQESNCSPPPPSRLASIINLAFIFHLAPRGPRIHDGIAVSYK
ncbi:MAG: hypothetical protein ORN57_00075 [Alphaproteobacteria bacterium]|nr:hypothetical protein [Alphaproteobacteria bacterium]